MITILFAPTLSLSGVVSKVANFSEGSLANWEEKSFEGNSQYRFVDAQTAGINSQKIKDKQQVLRASTQGQASGLFKEVNIDLSKTPYLNWSWQVQNLFKDNDERSKEGDDYPARIYVVVSGGVFFWNTKAINYVWSSNQPVGSEWPNAFTGNAKMLAVRSGEKQLGQWITERRNVREDLKKFFGEDVKKIDAIAVMVDGGWWMVDGGWWMVDGGWWMVDGGWWMVIILGNPLRRILEIFSFLIKQCYLLTQRQKWLGRKIQNHQYNTNVSNNF